LMAKNLGTIAKRTYFTNQDDIINPPNLVDHQNTSFQWFVDEGLGELLAEISPIDDYTGTKLSISFKDYHFEDPKMSESEARANNVSFDAPLKATVELTNKVTGEIKEQEIYLGDYPWMTSRGTFVINGAERVVVSQLIRSSGVFFTADPHGTTNLYGAARGWNSKPRPPARCSSKSTASARSPSPLF
jgi:DNA-directed RNA polymerase subunit beta